MTTSGRDHKTDITNLDCFQPLCSCSAFPRLRFRAKDRKNWWPFPIYTMQMEEPMRLIGRVRFATIVPSLDGSDGPEILKLCFLYWSGRLRCQVHERHGSSVLAGAFPLGKSWLNVSGWIIERPPQFWSHLVSRQSPLITELIIYKTVHPFPSNKLKIKFSKSLSFWQIIFCFFSNWWRGSGPCDC